MDLCVHYKECQEFTPPGTSAVQVYYGNVYLSTVIVLFPVSKPFHVQIAAELLLVHTEYLAKCMNQPYALLCCLYLFIYCLVCTMMYYCCIIVDVGRLLTY